MPSFIARVELHSATYADYESLHLYMQQRRYSRVIKGDDGKTYQLPTGTYTSVGNFTSTPVALQSAVAAANAIGKASSVIVAERISTSWQGLLIVNAARNS
jgi:hypothetical protein